MQSMDLKIGLWFEQIEGDRLSLHGLNARETAMFSN
jgi:hypothetical protein